VAWLAVAAVVAAVGAVALMRLRSGHGAAKRTPKEDTAAADRAVENTELQEIELDYAMGKLSEDDYRALVARYTRSDPRLERGASPAAAYAGVGESDSAVELEREAEAMVKRARETTVACPECGPRPEPQAIYCSNCGRYLHRCPACGQEIVAALARYCSNCGRLLSAPDVPVAGAPTAAETQ